MKSIIFVSCLSCLLASYSGAIYAPRALGMGQAFTALADDAFAAYYNPAGFAVNPGLDLAGNYQVNNRNQAAGDNALALKGCFEIGLNPFEWLAGVGLASALTYQGAKYLSDQGVVKKNWSREEKSYSQEDSASLAQDVNAQGAEQTAIISKREFAKQALKTLARGTIQVADKFANAVVKEAPRQTTVYFYASPWHQPDYYRPTYWDNRYSYREKEITPAGKAQFGGGLTIMSDQNSTTLNTNWYAFSLASGWGEIAAVGANLNVYDLKIPSTGNTGLGAGFDLGALLRLDEKLFFGLTAKEILTTDITWSNGDTTHYMMQVNVGAALKPLPMLTLAADQHNLFGQGGGASTAHFGVEFKPVYGLALRAGLDKNNKTAGLSFGLGQLIIDYAYLGGAYNRAQMIGATWQM